MCVTNSGVVPANVVVSPSPKEIWKLNDAACAVVEVSLTRITRGTDSPGTDVGIGVPTVTFGRLATTLMVV